MVERLGVCGLLTAVALQATPSRAQDAGGGVAIDHKAVGCIVAGKYPKLNACFTPNGSVARARVYFRAEGGTSWYYVEMKSDAPCMSGILPKPRKEMVDKHVNYYIHVADKSFTESRTEEYDPVVVAGEGDCKAKVLAAELPKASVQVFGAGTPAGFAAGGLSTAAAVGGGAAVVGAAGGIYAATKSSNNSTTTTFGATTTTTPTSGGTTTTTTVTTLAPTTTTTFTQTFTFSLSVTPTAGTAPLSVTVDMCGSQPTSALRYFYDFDGDGVVDFQGPICSQTRTYNVNTVGVFPSQVAPTTTTLAHHTWTVVGCAEPRVSYVVPQEKICGTATVSVHAAPPPVTTFPTGSFGAGAPATVQGLSLSSELSVEGATAQVVANGTSAFFPNVGRSTTVTGRKGQNRIEAQLVQASGKPGTWRFDFAPGEVVAGSLKVVAGDAVLVTPDTVVFRMKGVPGERVFFTVDAK